MTGLLARPLEPKTDEADLIELFETVFGHTVTPFMWEWKYQPPWAGRHFCYVGVIDGKVIGYFGAVPLRGMVEGRPVPFFQFADFMVHPKHRMRHDYFSHGLEAVMRDLASGGDHLIYGFSDHRAFLGFRRVGLSGLVEKATTRYVRSTVAQPSAELQIVDWPWDSPHIDTVWLRELHSIKVGLIRDRQYLGWRYGGHPVYRYRLFGVERRGVPVGFLVIGNDGAGKGGRPKEIPVVDMLVPESLAKDALHSLSAHLDHDLMAWLPGHFAPGFEQQKETGTHVFHFPRNSVRDTESLRQDLYYTMGDVDWW